MVILLHLHKIVFLTFNSLVQIIDFFILQIKACGYSVNFGVKCSEIGVGSGDISVDLLCHVTY